MQVIRKYKSLIVVCAAVLAIWMVQSNAAERSPKRTTNEYQFSVGEYKSDMARMVEAYEKLSSEYLSVVQQNLSMMSFNDQQILNKLTAMEKKLDALTQKVDALSSQKIQSADAK